MLERRKLKIRSRQIIKRESEDKQNAEVKSESVVKKETVHLQCDNCKKDIICTKQKPIYICCQSCGNLDLKVRTPLEFECLCGKKGSIGKGEKVFCCSKRTMIFR